MNDKKKVFKKKSEKSRNKKFDRKQLGTKALNKGCANCYEPPARTEDEMKTER